ncbi:group XIIB secretory phospholipase A2-like protein isoform X1 [Anguilla rostrata]|uniref:group XIIB secretory phospholipase A2-like protein isoform X1 n=1 Tax=Anguilla rostrata TaxID=7938 RepID=UPI0030CDBB02
MAPRTRFLLPLLLLCLALRAAAALAQEQQDAPGATPAPPEGLGEERAPVASQPEPSGTPPAPRAPPAEPQEESDWGLNYIRETFQAANGYFESIVEMMGGRNGVCQYRCRYGKAPLARPNYKTPEPNGCSSSLLGLQVPESLDLGIPAMTKCCNQLDLCYDTCGSNKYRCDSKFRWCLHGICSDLKRSLGFVSKVEACESVADTLYNTIWTLGCRPYMNSQRAACFCEGEERNEL